MNQDIIQTQWTQLRGALKAKWGKLTEDDLGHNGDFPYLVGKLQERYGWHKDQAEREIRDFSRTLSQKVA